MKNLKKKEQVAEPKPVIRELEEIETVPEEEQNVVFKPNVYPQTEFLARGEEKFYMVVQQVGVNFATLADPLRYMGHPNFSGLFFRHNGRTQGTHLNRKNSIRKSERIKWSERKMGAPSGARLWMSYLDRDQDVMRYQGLAFSWIGFDELTQWSSPFAWNYMRSRLRSTASDLPIFMRATTNPVVLTSVG